MERVQSDNRFSHVLQDPRFRRVPKKERKVKIDKRFQAMFKDKEFKLKYSMDKRGRPINHTTNEDLKKYYDLSSSETNSSDEEEENIPTLITKKTKKKSKLKKYNDNEDDETEANEGDGIKSQKCLRRSGEEESEDGEKSEDDAETETTKEEKFSEESEEQSSDEEEPEIETVTDDKRITRKKSKKVSIDIEEKTQRKMNKKKPNDSSDGEESEEVSEGETDSESESDKIDLARGEGNVESTDSDSTSSDESDDEADEFSHPWGELDAEAKEASDATCRLAVCNMDWDRIKADDVFVLLNSFKPADGIIHSVKIYPSEYGKERLKEEDVCGPKELTEEKLPEGEQEDPEGSDFHMEKLRKYQLNRLRYYYAVVECDSLHTANKIYEECEGMEYESSSVRMDLRFIPDDMVFDEKPMSVSTHMPEPSMYHPSLFTTTALQQAKVDLTWDETDPNRTKTLQEAFTNENLDSVNVGAFVASGSESEFEEEKEEKDHDENEDEFEGEDTKSRIAKYRSLLLSLDDDKGKSDDVQMEITWTPGLKEATEEIVKKKQDEDSELTPWDQFLKKKRDKKEQKRELKKMQKNDNLSDDDVPSDVDLNDPFFKEDFGPEFEKNKTKRKKQVKPKNQTTGANDDDGKKAELELLFMNEDRDRHHFNLKSIMNEQNSSGKSKRKAPVDPVEDCFEINLTDNRFDALYTSHLYNVDPSDPQFKRTKGMEAIMEEKQKRRETGNTDFIPPPAKKLQLNDSEIRTSKSSQKDPELSRLVKSVKSKARVAFGKKKRWH